MAYYAALTPLLQLLEDIILYDRYPNFRLGKHRVMESIYKKFALLEESLEGYSSKGDEANYHVEARIRDVAHRAQDAIELEILNSLVKKRTSSMLGFAPITALHRKMRCMKFVTALRETGQEIASVLEEMAMIKERQAIEDPKLHWDSSDTSAIQQGTTPSNTNTVVGCDDDLIIIKGQLCGQPSQLQVIPIVGTGGIGKTTLARHAYDDDLVVYRFDYRAWVVVSQDFNVVQFLQTISKSLGIRTHIGLLESDEGALKEGIYKHLKGMRYLIVIDDIWCIKVWDDVKQIFPNDNNGSRIMLTTRLSDVAEYASTSGFLHKVRFLNDDQSWNLLQERVFGQGHCPSELEDIGKAIARYCCGLPLAVVVIAGVLSTTKLQYEWEKVAVRVREILSDKDELLYKILSLSYNNLSHQLKACFLYLGSFPEDDEINISNLIRLWVAEGFLKSNDETKILEDVAAECLMNLVERNLLLITKKRRNGQPKFCALHDLLRDFCRERAFRETFFHAKHDARDLYPEANNKVRHINWYHNSDNGSLHERKIGKLLRSIHRFGDNHSSISKCFKSVDFKLVRVFNEFERRGTLKESVPDVLFQMFNLRYLGFGPLTHIRSFPSTLLLQNIQSLILQYVDYMGIELPPQIWKMTNLRHIVVPHMILPSVPQGIDDKLECLQTLMTVRDLTVTDEAIEMIPNLRNLKMEYDMYVDERKLYCINNLFRLSRLEELKIRMERIQTQHLPSKYNFPLNLRKLSLQGCRLWWKYSTCVGSLPHLQVLRLGSESFVGEEWEPNENEFLCLKFLLLAGLDLRYWQADETHFPCLEHLEIDCPDLETIPLEIGDIPTLKVIKVNANGRNVGKSATSIRAEQKKQGNDDLQVYINKCHQYGY